MYILLASATAPEIQPLCSFLERSSFLPGGHETSVVTTGVGSLAATYSLTHSLIARRPDLVIMAGIAGCFTDKRAGDLVVVGEEVLGDLGVWEDRQFRTLTDLGLQAGDSPPFSNGLLVNPYSKLLGFTGLERVRGVTVNEISTDPDRIRWLQQNMRPVVESMEGAALHYTCLQQNIAFLQIRSVSNAIGIRDKARWNIGTALDTLNSTLIDLLTRL
ncbi:MAG: futalosine hydrolase, partial [Bacteroidota bacterium]|nr:futalosine hydrolase [Bacteroidota bacterium]